MEFFSRSFDCVHWDKRLQHKAAASLGRHDRRPGTTKPPDVDSDSGIREPYSRRGTAPRQDRLDTGQQSERPSRAISRPTINWGDGHSSAGTVVSTAIAGRFDITGTNTYLTPGSYPINIVVTDYEADSATVASTAFVAAPTLTPVGTTANFLAGTQSVSSRGWILPRFQSQGVPGTSRNDKWGYGPSSAGIVTASTTTGLFVVQGTKVYTATGIPISIAANDNLGDTANPRARLL